MSTVQELAQQIRARGGKWDVGRDRALELATILVENGITDLSQLRTNKLPEETETYASPDGLLDPSSATFQPYELFYGDQQLGYLGNVGEKGYEPKTRREPGKWYFGDKGLKIGSSAAGRGGVDFYYNPETGQFDTSYNETNFARANKDALIPAAFVIGGGMLASALGPTAALANSAAPAAAGSVAPAAAGSVASGGAGVVSGGTGLLAGGGATGLTAAGGATGLTAPAGFTLASGLGASLPTSAIAAAPVAGTALGSYVAKGVSFAGSVLDTLGLKGSDVLNLIGGGLKMVAENDRIEDANKRNDELLAKQWQREDEVLDKRWAREDQLRAEDRAREDQKEAERLARRAHAPVGLLRLVRDQNG